MPRHTLLFIVSAIVVETRHRVEAALRAIVVEQFSESLGCRALHLLRWSSIVIVVSQCSLPQPSFFFSTVIRQTVTSAVKEIRNNPNKPNNPIWFALLVFVVEENAH